jgi:hypothetical protein
VEKWVVEKRVVEKRVVEKWVVEESWRSEDASVLDPWE